MDGTHLAPSTLEGWYVLHQFLHLARPSLLALPEEDREELGREFAALLEGWEDLGEGGWSGSYRIVGGGVDILLLHFRPSLDDLGDAERRVLRSPLADHLHPSFEYVSVVELGLYTLTASVMERAEEEGVPVGGEEWSRMLEEAAEEERAKPYVQERLHPRQPEEMQYVSFYPMDKRRAPGANWYALPFAERARMMSEHGKIGRLYAGKVSQVISGSVGLDDWEWGVTLFSGDPLHFKSLVTEMRYDEVSAEYAEFGPFYVGRRLPSAAWREPAEL